jgi:hypothetical protein
MFVPGGQTESKNKESLQDCHILFTVVNRNVHKLRSLRLEQENSRKCAFRIPVKKHAGGKEKIQSITFGFTGRDFRLPISRSKAARSQRPANKYDQPADLTFHLATGDPAVNDVLPNPGTRSCTLHREITPRLRTDPGQTISSPQHRNTILCGIFFSQ